MQIQQATINHLQDLIPLFDAYRVFYKQTSDTVGAKKFLKARIIKKESIIYIAYSDAILVGFTQLYKLFSSVSMEPMYILNDLFIHSEYRNRGIGTALINTAKSLCKEKAYKGLIIQTENHNPAQYLYQREDFVKDNDLYFFWKNEYDNRLI